METNQPKSVAAGEGLTLQSGPGRDLIFKATGDETGGAFDYFVVGVAPHGGPPLHVHRKEHETIYVLKGQYKIRSGDEIFRCGPGDFAYLPKDLPHAFLNLTDEPGEILVTFVPGGGHKFFEELGPAARGGSADPKELAAIFEKHDMSVLGPPLSADD